MASHVMVRVVEARVISLPSMGWSRFPVAAVLCAIHGAALILLKGLLWLVPDKFGKRLGVMRRLPGCGLTIALFAWRLRAVTQRPCNWAGALLCRYTSVGSHAEVVLYSPVWQLGLVEGRRRCQLG